MVPIEALTVAAELDFDNIITDSAKVPVEALTVLVDTDPVLVVERLGPVRLLRQHRRRGGARQ